MHKGLNPGVGVERVLFLFLIAAHRRGFISERARLAAEHVLYISGAGVSAGDAVVVYHESIARIRSVK